MLLLAIFLLLIACQSEKENKESHISGQISGHQIVAEEVIQTNTYTYIKGREGNESYWIAVAKRNVAEGTVLYFKESMEMKNFESKDLARTFESILFVDQISEQPFTSSGMGADEGTHQRSKGTMRQDVEIEAAENGISISKLYAEKAKYTDATVIVTGKVTKFNAGIMGRNWVHIQDGTQTDGKFDLTITTADKVALNEVVTFKGTVAVDKDFGAGYRYELIIENASLIK
jgi:hypothetical protein